LRELVPQRGAAAADEGADAALGLPRGAGHRDLARPDRPVRRPRHRVLGQLAAAAALAIGFGTWLYGACLLQVYGFTQQRAGMGENVLDHRLNTRTVKLCVVNRFLYWNLTSSPA
jgi:hypothetical protein